jgi:hypothetical protein
MEVGKGGGLPYNGLPLGWALETTILRKRKKKHHAPNVMYRNGEVDAMSTTCFASLP